MNWFASVSCKTKKTKLNQRGSLGQKINTVLVSIKVKTFQILWGSGKLYLLKLCSPFYAILVLLNSTIRNLTFIQLNPHLAMSLLTLTTIQPNDLTTLSNLSMLGNHLLYFWPPLSKKYLCVRILKKGLTIQLLNSDSWSLIQAPNSVLRTCFNFSGDQVYLDSYRWYIYFMTKWILFHFSH